jgi:uncharacterized membrane protein YdjX (TVP38/TMEM64 family)
MTATYPDRVDDAAARPHPLDYAPPRRRRFGGAGAVAAVSLALPIFGSVATVVAAPFVAPWLRAQGAAGVLFFVVTFMLLGAVAVAPTYSTSVIAGWTFGFRVGWAAVMVATVVGAMLCYAAARRAAGARVAAAFHDHPKWELVRRALVDARGTRTLWLVVLLRLSPVLPFGTTNVLLATTGVRPLTYALGTLLGLAPRTGVIAAAAAGAERLDLTVADSWWLLAAGTVATAACIVTLAVVGKRALDRATREAPPRES